MDKIQSPRESRLLNRYTAFQKSNALIRVDDKFNMTLCGVPVVSSANIPMKVNVNVPESTEE